ncbi:maleylpyruvate isomerase N-terminal domain-containing protein [Streptomyces hokutonensis]|uniref:maleylpyruvate isomerase N-terminal domain-containing protein n=1 Tax=Streptomyces hokutonensis TaxID=1306990 RepID=UPI00381D2626
MSNADTIIAELRDGHKTLATMLAELSDEDLARQSGSADWDISQVLSHLGSGAEIARAILEAALDGTPLPSHDALRAVWDVWNAMSRRQRAQGFLRANDMLTTLYESLDAGTREKLRIDMGFLPAPVDVATAARLRLTEVTLHSWDIRVSFDQHAALPSHATGALLHGEPDLIAWIGKAQALDGRHAVIQVTTSDPASVFTLRLQEPISTHHAVPAQPDGTLALPAEAWLRLIAGRLAPQHTPETVTATDAADLVLLRRVFPGY